MQRYVKFPLLVGEYAICSRMFDDAGNFVLGELWSSRNEDNRCCTVDRDRGRHVETSDCMETGYVKIHMQHQIGRQV